MPFTITPALLAENRDISYTDYLQQIIIDFNNLGITRISDLFIPEYLTEAERETIKAELVGLGFTVTEEILAKKYFWTIDWALTS